MIVFLSLFLLPILATILMPRRWLTPWALFLALASFVLLFEESRARGSLGAAVGIGLFMWEMLAIAGILLARLYQAPNPHEAAVAGQGTMGSAAVTWALVAAGSSVALTALWVQGWNFALDSGLATHVAVIGFAIAWFMLTPLGWSSRPSWWSILTLHPSNVFRGVGTVAIGATLVWSLQMAPKVKAQAELASRGQPYCILATGAQGLRAVRSNFDLTGFVMQAGRGAQRHAQLASGGATAPEWRYWSYRKGLFQSEAMGGVLQCELQPQFAEKLAWFPIAQTGDGALRFWLGGGQWAIPNAFHGSARDKPATLSFYAQGRDAVSLNEGLLRNGGANGDQYAKQVDVTLCTPKKLHVWQVDGDPYVEVESVGIEYGLAKQKASYGHGLNPIFLFKGHGTTGNATTWVQCDGGAGYCHHAFARAGMVIRFMHPESELADWKLLQDGLWRRVKSFAVVWPDVPVQACDPP